MCGTSGAQLVGLHGRVSREAHCVCGRPEAAGALLDAANASSFASGLKQDVVHT